jgi:glutamine cyclotransferase
MKSRVQWLLFLSFALAVGCTSTTKKLAESLSDSWPCYTLRAEKTWQLNAPNGERFDASGLLLQKRGQLLTVNDRGAELYKIDFAPGYDAANLVPLTNVFTDAQLARFAKEKFGRFDCEGIAQDGQGRIYLCEEGNRWILRFDPKTKKVERLPIDWSPVEKYFYPRDRNASFEGIAIGDGKLFVANERQEGRIIVVDLKTLKILDDFTVRPSKTKMQDIHYSDLCWFDGALFALLRENRVVVKIDPKGKRILAEYNFQEMENQPEVIYSEAYSASTMEGLAVDQNYFWLVTDNNGWKRVNYPKDFRSTLFKCKRPD